MITTKIDVQRAIEDRKPASGSSSLAEQSRDGARRRWGVHPTALFLLAMVSILLISAAFALVSALGGAPRDASATTTGDVNPTAAAPPPPEYPSIYFTKTPKAGGTTFALILQRYAADAGGSVYVPPFQRWGAQTCRARLNESAFSQLKSNNDHENPKVFESQACVGSDANFFESFDLRIGIVRHPMKRHQSAYEYLRDRCQRNDPKLPRFGECGPALKSYQAYTLKSCRRSWYDACSGQARYLDSADKHDFLIVTDRYEESLVALHMLHNLPLYAFLHLNHNPDDPQKLLPLSKLAHRAAEKGLRADFAIYRAANDRLDDTIATSLDPIVFNTLLNALKSANADAKDNCRLGVMDPPAFECLNRDFPTIFKGSAACFVKCVSKFDVVPMVDAEYEFVQADSSAERDLPVLIYQERPRKSHLPEISSGHDQ